jgi:hypothetical protein
MPYAHIYTTYVDFKDHFCLYKNHTRSKKSSARLCCMRNVPEVTDLDNHYDPIRSQEEGELKGKKQVQG